MTHKAEEKHLPATIDLSPKAVERAVVGEVWQKPYTVWPAVLGVIGVGVGAVMESALGLGVGLVLAMFGVGSGVVNHFFRYRILAALYVNRIRRQQQEYIQNEPERLRADLERLDCAAGVEQVSQLVTKFAEFERALNAKLTPGELTHARYLGMAEKVQEIALHELRHAVTLLESVESVEPTRLKERLTQAVAAEAAASIRARLALHDEVFQDVSAVLAANEAALTALDDTAVRLARIRTGVGRSEGEIAAIMAEFARLAKRAQLYETNYQ